MLVQMVGADIGNHRHIWSADHAVQLEGAELQNGNILRVHLRYVAQQRFSDIPSEVDSIARLFQQFRYNRGSGGLPVASCYGNDPAGAELKEHFHL